MQDEFRLALAAYGDRPPETIYFIPVKLDECEVPNLQIPYRGLSTRDFQWLDLWQEGGFERLIRALEKGLGITERSYLRNIHGEMPDVADFVGRDKELETLTGHFSDNGVAICGVIAGSGIGKTALVSHWLSKINSCGKRVPHFSRPFSEFGGSTSFSDSDFVADALNHFGFHFGFEGSLSEDSSEEEDPLEHVTKNVEDLTNVFYTHSGVLVLDGLEPFTERSKEEAGSAEFVTDSPGSRERVAKLDDALTMLIDKIQEVGERRGNRERLVIITSRKPLDRFVRANSYKPLQLDSLSDDDGADLLRKRGSGGNQKDLKEASYTLYGHPLALSLFPKYVKDKYAGDAERALKSDNFLSEIMIYGQMKFVEKWARTVISSKVWDDHHPQKILLEMMSLVHRDLKTPEFDALIDASQLARPVQMLSETDWKKHCEQLHEGGLLVRQEEDFKGQEGVLKGWTCHFVIRNCMRESLRCEKPKLWEDAHSVLFDHFDKISRPEPRTPEELFTVYRAITHGCQAGRYAEAYKIYNERCLQGEWTAASTNNLGSFADDAVVLRLLSEAGIEHSELSDEDRAIVLGRLAFCCTCLGWLGDAIIARQQELAIWKSNPLADRRESIRRYAASAIELSSVYLYRGSLPAAERYADDAIKTADESGDWWTRMRSRVRKALVEYVKNNVDTAQHWFKEAEEIQSDGDIERRRPILYGEEGWFYNTFLLDTERKSPSEVADRCKKIRSIKQTDYGAKEEWKVLKGLNGIALGFALLKQGKEGDGWNELTGGLNELRKARSQVHLVPGLLRKARAHINTGETKYAREVINEVIMITNDLGLPYYLANAYILDIENAIKTVTAISGKAEDEREAKEYFEQASSRLDQIKNIMHSCSYFLCEAEVSRLEQKIGQGQIPPPSLRPRPD